MNSYFFVLVIVPFALCCNHGNIRCRSDWVPYRCHCYKFASNKVSWYQAKKNCNTYGGYLVRIDTWHELNWLKLQATANDNHANFGYYIGLTDANYENHWVWESNDERLVIWDFKRPEPNGTRRENCVLLHTEGKDAKPPYKYHDVGCQRKEMYICEKDYY